MAWVTVRVGPPWASTFRYFVGEELISGPATEDVRVEAVECSSIEVANMVRDALNAAEA